MRVTLEVMLPFVKPGGLFFVEDLSTQYEDVYRDMGAETMVKLIQEIVDVLHDIQQPTKRPQSALAVRLASLVDFVECWGEICVLGRNSKPA